MGSGSVERGSSRVGGRGVGGPPGLLSAVCITPWYMPGPDVTSCDECGFNRVVVGPAAPGQQEVITVMTVWWQRLL